jgi:hypothetical protein
VQAALATLDRLTGNSDPLKAPTLLAVTEGRAESLQADVSASRRIMFGGQQHSPPLRSVF